MPSASSVAVMVEQWLHRYDLGLSGNSHEVARVRKYHYESLVEWRVVEIVAFLPIVPQISLLLFLAALLILLWALHALFIVTAATILLPAVKIDCLYQSPLILGFFFTLQAFHALFCKTREKSEV